MNELSMKKALELKGVTNVYHLTHIANISSILRNGLLSRNEMNDRGLIYEDISPDNFRRKGERNLNRAYGEDIYDFNRLSFTSPIPFTRSVFFGKKLHHKTVLIQISTDIFDEMDYYYTDKGCLYEDLELSDSPSDLDNLDFEILNTDLDKLMWEAEDEHQKKEIREKRSAEILISDTIERKYLTNLIVYSQEAFDRFGYYVKKELDEEIISKLRVKIDHESKFLPAFVRSSTFQHKIYGKDLKERQGKNFVLGEEFHIDLKKSGSIMLPKSYIERIGFDELIDITRKIFQEIERGPIQMASLVDYIATRFNLRKTLITSLVNEFLSLPDFHSPEEGVIDLNDFDLESPI